MTNLFFFSLPKEFVYNGSPLSFVVVNILFFFFSDTLQLIVLEFLTVLFTGVKTKCSFHFFFLLKHHFLPPALKNA